jgi:hypothetical protein
VHGSERFTIAANFGDRPLELPVTIAPAGSTVVLSTHLDREGSFDGLVLRPHEGLILVAPS